MHHFLTPLHPSQEPSWIPSSNDHATASTSKPSLQFFHDAEILPQFYLLEWKLSIFSIWLWTASTGCCQRLIRSSSRGSHMAENLPLLIFLPLPCSFTTPRTQTLALTQVEFVVPPAMDPSQTLMPRPMSITAARRSRILPRWSLSTWWPQVSLQGAVDLTLFWSNFGNRTP